MALYRSPLNAASNITHSPLKILHEWQRPPMRIVQYPVQWKISFCRWQRKLRKVGMIPYRTVQDITCKSATSRNCHWCGGTGSEWSALQSSVRISWTAITRSSLAWENNGIPQTGLTLAYTINPYGPSTGHVSRYFLNLFLPTFKQRYFFFFFSIKNKILSKCAFASAAQYWL